MKPLITNPKAEAEFAEAAEWYERQKEGLAAQFLASVQEAIDAIRRIPRAFPLFRSTSIRKYVVQRFPYVIFYEGFPNHIALYAITHAKRKPGYWQDRGNDKS